LTVICRSFMYVFSPYLLSVALLAQINSPPYINFFSSYAVILFIHHLCLCLFLFSRLVFFSSVLHFWDAEIYDKRTKNLCLRTMMNIPGRTIRCCKRFVLRWKIRITVSIDFESRRTYQVVSEAFQNEFSDNKMLCRPTI